MRAVASPAGSSPGQTSMAAAGVSLGGVWRNLTTRFLELRAAHQRHAEEASLGWQDGGAGGVGDEERVRLVAGEDGRRRRGDGDAMLARAEAGEASSTALAGGDSSLPPEWVDQVEQVRYTLARIQARMDELAQLHDTHVNRPTFDDNAQEEHVIEIMTQEITKMFHQGQREIKTIAAIAQRSARQAGVSASASATQERMTRNVMASLAKELQSASLEFRRRQASYLQRLRGREDRASQFTIGGADFDTVMTEELAVTARTAGGAATAAGAGVFGSYDDRGFTEMQMLALQENTAMVEEREREITQIVSTIAELQTIFKDLATLVIDQGTILDNIAYNIEMASQHVEEGVGELKKGEKYQKRSRKSLCILLLLVAVIVMFFVIILTKG